MKNTFFFILFTYLFFSCNLNGDMNNSLLNENDESQKITENCVILSNETQEDVSVYILDYSSYDWREENSYTLDNGVRSNFKQLDKITIKSDKEYVLQLDKADTIVTLKPFGLGPISGYTYPATYAKYSGITTIRICSYFDNKIGGGLSFSWDTSKGGSVKFRTPAGTWKTAFE